MKETTRTCGSARAHNPFDDGAEERLRRICARDGLTAEQAATRISAGKPDAFYRARCDYIIRNSGSEADFLKKIRRTAEIILKKSKEGAP